MNENNLHEIPEGNQGLTPDNGQMIDRARLVAVLVAWWRGDSYRQIGNEHGISHQRVSAILQWLGTSEKYRDDDRLIHPTRKLRIGRETDEYRRMLSHRLFPQLTPRQRGAICWLSTGMATLDVAKRMGTSAGGVYGFVYCAQKRLEKLKKKEQMAATAKLKPKKKQPQRPPNKPIDPRKKKAILEGCNKALLDLINEPSAPQDVDDIAIDRFEPN